MILNLKAKVVSDPAKTWFIKINKHLKHINIFANIRIQNTQFNLFYQYMLLLTKVKQFLNLLKIKKGIGATLLATTSL